MEAWKHIRAVLLLPFMATVVTPGVIVVVWGTDTFGVWQSVHAARFLLPTVGVGLISAGLALMIATNWLFATLGKGTLAPWNPTQKLVVRGVYRHVRNPMMTGVFSILLGEAVAAASLPLLCWFALFVVVVVVLIPLVEEPMLVRQFGAEYEDYRRNVPRWIPAVKGYEAAVENQATS